MGKNKLKPLTSTFVILSIFALLGVGLAIILFKFIYLDQEESAGIFVGSIFLYIGISALISIKGLLNEAFYSKGDFYSLEQGVGNKKILEIANNISDKLIGYPFKVFTNKNGVLIVQDIDKKDVVTFTNGQMVDTNVRFICKSMLPMFFKVNDYSANIIKLDNTLKVSMDRGGDLKERELLKNVILESKKENKWKALMDSIGLFALNMALLGGLGAVFTALLLLFTSLLKK